MLIINAVSSPVTSDRISLYCERLPITFAVVGLTAGEQITVQFEVNDIWEDLYIAGNKCILTSTNKMTSVFAPLSLRLVKPLTANPVSVTMYYNNIEAK